MGGCLYETTSLHWKLYCTPPAIAQQSALVRQFFAEAFVPPLRSCRAFLFVVILAFRVLRKRVSGRPLVWAAAQTFVQLLVDVRVQMRVHMLVNTRLFYLKEF